jgi:Lon protease-like protein
VNASLPLRYARRVSAVLPVFPLGTVLFPGLVLPLHVFEERYRALVRDLMALPSGRAREFGVVAIQRGWEVERSVFGPNPTGEKAARKPAEGDDPGSSADAATPDTAVPSAPETSITLFEVGCSAELRQVSELPDGGFDIVTIGRRRFRMTGIDSSSAPYLNAEVEWLSEPLGEPGAAERLAPGVLAVFQRYLRRIRARTDSTGEQLPEEPTVLSYLIAASASLKLDERQELLAVPDTAARLRAERELLSREVALLDRVRAVPVPLAELAVPSSPN